MLEIFEYRYVRSCVVDFRIQVDIMVIFCKAEATAIRFICVTIEVFWAG